MYYEFEREGESNEKVTVCYRIDGCGFCIWIEQSESSGVEGRLSLSDGRTGSYAYAAAVDELDGVHQSHARTD